MVHAVRNVGHIYIYIPLSENLSDDLVRVKLRVRQKLCLIDLSNFQIYHALRTHRALYCKDRL